MISIQELIDQAVLANNQVKSSERDTHSFHVSDAGLCYRSRFLKRLGVAPTTVIPAANLRKMLAGDAGHLMLQNLLRRQSQLFASENELGDGIHIKGHFDGIVKDDKEKAVLEIKTIEKYQIPYIKTDGPKPQHLIQLFTYWTFLREDYKNLDQAILAYVKREDFEAQAYDYAWSDEIRAQVAAEWSPLIDYWMRKELPPCTCDKDYGGSGIKYCRFRNEETKTCCAESLFVKEEIIEAERAIR